jgi:hypothetical protein
MLAFSTAWAFFVFTIFFSHNKKQASVGCFIKVAARTAQAA